MVRDARGNHKEDEINCKMKFEVQVIYCHYKTLLKLLFVCMALFCSGVEVLADIKTGLKGYYPLDGNAKDRSGNNNNGVLYSAVQASGKFGNPNRAYSFDGVNQKVSIPNSIDLQIPGDFTLSLWINVSQLPNLNEPSLKQSWFIQKSSWVNQTGFQLLDNGYASPDIIFRTYNGSSFNDIYLPRTQFSLNTWHHLVGVRRGTTNELWLNSVKKGSVTANTYAMNNANLIVGDKTHGRIDEVRIYNRALSTSDITGFCGNRRLQVSIQLVASVNSKVLWVFQS